jgi:hypothetical protein
MRRRPLGAGLLFLLGLGAWDPAAAAEGEARLVIAQPGYPGSTAEAKEFISRLTKAVEAGGGPKLAGGEYHNVETAALEAIERDRPAVGIVSLGFYLKHRRSLALKPLVWSQPEEAFAVAARKGTMKSLADLSGKTVSGTPLLEAEFVARVLFAPSATGGASAAAAWKPAPERLFSKAIREVARGRSDAVLLSGREYEAMKRLGAGAELERIHSTAAYPVALAVRLGEGAGGEAAKGFAAALEALNRTADGKDLLETMGIGGFKPIDAARLGAIEALFDAPPPAAKEPAK